MFYQGGRRNQPSYTFVLSGTRKQIGRSTSEHTFNKRVAISFRGSSIVSGIK